VKKSVEQALDDSKASGKWGRLLREERAITLREFADMLGWPLRRARSMLNIRGGDVLERVRDPLTGDWFLTTRSVIEWLERRRDLEDTAEQRKGETEEATAQAIRAAAGSFLEGPRLYTLREFAELTGLDPDYARTMVTLGRVPTVKTERGPLIPGPFARRYADQVERNKRAAAEKAVAENMPRPVMPEERTWVPIEEAAAIFGVKPNYLLEAAARRMGLLVMQQGGRLMVSGPTLARAREQRSREER
jgi:hypothetical protein